MKKVFFTLLLLLPLMPIKKYLGYYLFAQDKSSAILNISAAKAHVDVKNPKALEHDFITISSSWAYYENRFLPASYFYSADSHLVPPEQQPIPDSIVSLPHFWNNPHACATYHLLVTGLKPQTEYAVFMYDRFSTAGDIWCNGTFVYIEGVPSEDWTKTECGRNMDIAVLPSDKNGNADIVMHCSNKIYRSGGVYFNIRLAERAHVEHWFVFMLILRAMFIGSLVLIFIYQFALYLFRHKKSVHLYLSLFAFFAMIRLLFATFSIVTLWFPNIPYEISLKLELAPIYFCSFFYYLYMLAYDGISENKPVTYVMKGVCVFCLVTNFCLPLRIANYFTPFYEAYMLLGGFLYGLYLTFTKKKKTLEENFGEPMRRRHKRSFNMFDFIGFIVIFGGCVHDVAVLWGISMPFAYGDWIMYSFILFVIVQSVNTAWRWDTLNTRIKSLAVQTARANNAAYRFVPQQFLRLLGKNDICSVKAKDHCTKKVALLSADLRNFTTISEGMNGAEVFSLLNEYFRAVAPIIRQYGGFIEKVMGDGIVAIFDSPCDGALACAIDMQSAMVGLRESFAARSLPVFEIGIGVHYGQVVLGIVGSDKRMSEVVVSPAVDIADDVEGYNKVCREPVLASEEAVAAIKEKDKFSVELVRPASSMNGEGRQDGTYSGTIYKVQRS